jgi:DnaK suppressor protein
LAGYNSPLSRLKGRYEGFSDVAVKKPAKKVVKQPAKAAVKKPAAKSAAKPAATSAKPAAKPAAKQAVKPAVKPVAKQTVKPAAKPAPKPATKAVAKPVAKKPVAKPAAKPAVKSVAKKPAAKQAAKPATKSVPAAKPASKVEMKAPVAKAPAAKAPAVKTPAAKPAAKVETKAADKPTPTPTPAPTPAPPPTPQPQPQPKPDPKPEPTPPIKPPKPGPRPNPNDTVPKAAVKPVVVAPRPTTGKVAVAVTSRQSAPPPKTQVKVIPYKTDEATGRPILPHGYKPAADEEYMSQLQLEYFRQRLLGWRADLIEESKQTIENLKDEVRDVGDDAERATRETENSLELRTRDRYRKLIGKIDSTLKRVEAGEYGYSVDSGEEIGLHRLEARLTAERTIDEQERWEHLQKQQGD